MNVDVYDTFERSFHKLPEKARTSVREAIRTYEKVTSLRELQNVTDTKKLEGRNQWRTRVGDYRIIFFWDKDKQTIMLIHVDQRKDVYKKK